MISINLERCSNALLKAMARESKKPENIRKLLAFKEAVVYLEVAQNRYTDAETLTYLYNKYKQEVKYSLAENPSTCAEILHDITENCDALLARLLLENSNLAPEDIDCIYERYGMAGELEILEAVIDNPNTFGRTLIKLAYKNPQYTCKVLDTAKVKLVEA